MNRLTDNDRNFGPFTLARWNNRFSATFSSGDDEDPENHLLFVAFGWALRIKTPRFLRPGGKYQSDEREYGFSISADGAGYDFLQVYFGLQTHDSSTSRSWSKHFPWKQWECVRNSIYEPGGRIYATEQRGKWDDFYRVKQACPSSKFRVKDYDGAEILATCIIEEREWRRGEGWFKWLRLFYRPKIRRDLDICFSAEVGPEKGSWKGGTIGTGITMERHETPKMAFQRFCEKEHNAKGRKYRLQYLGQIPNTAVA